jgi:PAS domain S-box-containing protein
VQDDKNMLKELVDFKPDIILSDYEMPQFTGLDALQIAKKKCSETPFIIVTGLINEEIAVECMRQGAWDYVIKDKLVHLGHAVTNAIKLKAENEKKRLAEEALYKSEKRFKHLVKNSNDMIVIIDEKGKEIYVSDSVERITGFSIAEVLSHSSFEFLHPDDVDHMSKTLSKLLKTPGVSIQDEYRHKRKNGGWVYLEAIGTNYLHEPSIKGIVLNVRDITERRQAEEELRRSEKQFRLFADNVPGVVNIYKWYPDGHREFIYQGPGLEKIIGEELAEKVKRNLDKYFELIPEEDFKNLDEASLRAMQTNMQLDCEYRLIIDDSNIKWIRSLYNMIPQEDSSILWHGMIYDVTERKQVQKALEENEDRYRQIYQFSPDTIIIHDIDMNILDANNKAVKEFGYSKEELLKMKVFELHPKIEQKHSAQVLTVLKKKDMLNVETKFMRKDGSVFLAEAIPCKYAIRNKPIIHVVIRDITEKRKIEEDMKKKIHELQIFNDITEGRELKMVELKKEINALLDKLGKEAKYKIAE